jgi:hypothetical protein
MQALLISGVVVRRVGSSKLRSFADIRPTGVGGMRGGPGECGLPPALRVAKNGIFGNIRPSRCVGAAETSREAGAGCVAYGGHCEAGISLAGCSFFPGQSLCRLCKITDLILHNHGLD